MTLGERLKYLRKEVLNLTLEKFGDRIGLKKPTLSNIENGNTNLSDQTRRSVCREFGVNEQWLLTGEGEPFAAKTRNEEIADFVKGLSTDNEDFKTKLITILSRMSSDEWDLLEKMVRRLANLDGEVAPVQLHDGQTAAKAELHSDSPSVEELEEEYKKIHSSGATEPEEASSASNTTAGNEASESKKII